MINRTPFPGPLSDMLAFFLPFPHLGTKRPVTPTPFSILCVCLRAISNARRNPLPVYMKFLCQWVLHGISVGGNACCSELPANGIMIAGGCSMKMKRAASIYPTVDEINAPPEKFGSISTILRLDAIRVGTCRPMRYCARIEMPCIETG